MDSKDDIRELENNFIELFGETKTVMEMLDTLIDHPTYGYTKRDLANQSNLSESAVRNNWDMLEKHNLIKQKNKDGGVIRYKLNTDSSIVEQLVKLSDAVQNVRRNENLVNNVSNGGK